jgi:DUF971 family protein
MIAIEPRDIEEEGDGGLRITWADGEVSHYTASALRRACPCRQCVDAQTGRRLLDPTTVPERLVIEDMVKISRHAVNLVFSDGHQIGIYEFHLLRALSDHGASL